MVGMKTRILDNVIKGETRVMKRNLIRRVLDVENMYFQISVLYEFKKDIIEVRYLKSKDDKDTFL